MDEITNKEVERYMYELLPARDGVLTEMEERARHQSIPIIGPAVASILYQYAVLIGARRIFEMGSAIGYSTIWLARAAGEHGRVYYTDGSQNNADDARRYFQRGGVADRIEILVGDAIDSLDRVEGEFDLIFNDVDKHQYPAALQKALPRLRKGGLFVTDNVLWSGRPARGETDPDTLGVSKFNQLIYSSPELFTTILPIRDGVAVCLKK